MSGWGLILALLVLGGVLSTLGDRLGSRVGKARLSLFNMRPRRTAVLITVLTGSLISALSLGLLLLVSRQLRVGLFELDGLQQRLNDSRKQLDAAETERRKARQDIARIEAALSTAKQRAETLRNELAPLEADRERLIQDIASRDADIRRTEAELNDVRSRIKAGEQELLDLERNLVALRRGAVVLSSGQTLATATVRLESPDQAKQAVDRLLREANLNAYSKVRPGEAPDRQLIRVPRSDVERLKGIISKPETWVISLRSATNVLRGELAVYAFPEVRPNRLVAREGDVLATTVLQEEEITRDAIRTRLNLLLASAYAEVQRRGSLSEGLKFDGNAVARLAQALIERPQQSVNLRVIAARDSNSADSVIVSIEAAP